MKPAPHCERCPSVATHRKRITLAAGFTKIGRYCSFHAPPGSEHHDYRAWRN